MHYAHERGVVHRDIKPGNIMLGSYGEVYLLDWGVASIAGVSDDEAEAFTDVPPVHTAPGAVLGSLETMAPEQAAGGKATPATDIYALGAVLFHILALEPLHEASSSDAEAREALALRIRGGVDARPTTRPRGEEVAPELEALCVEATRTHPNDRIPTALAFHERLESFLDGDRDLALRAESSQRHTTAARAALANAGDDGSAFREVGRALAFDPTNRDALAMLVELLTSVPREPPAEVIAEERVALARRLRVGALALSAGYGAVACYGWAAMALGLREPSVFGVISALWVASFAAALVAARWPSYAALSLACGGGVAASTYITKIYSPFLVVPLFLTIHATLFAFVGPARLRLGMVAAACAGWTLSVYGHALGVFPTTFELVNDAVLIRSLALRGSPSWVTAYLYVAGLTTLVAPALIVGAIRGAWQRNERALRLQAWRLRQLVPAEDAGPRS
ncbi:MAG: protein kinase [Labilithrix sp.]|nr:protein kinase [Labilithrix sp.]MCW5809764.1 protein kinase [Labilithrix sp.]